MPKIFISYRREDSQHQADRLYASLKKHLPKSKRDIFIDIDNIPVGVDFRDHIEERISGSDVLLALIGPAWLTCRDNRAGHRRLDDPDDYVRIEIATALRKGITVAPVLLDGAHFPAAEDLPSDLKALASRNGVEIRRTSFEADVARMIRGLGLKAPRSTTAAAEPQSRARGGLGRWAALAAAMLILTAGGMWVWLGNSGNMVAPDSNALPPIAAPVAGAAPPPASDEHITSPPHEQLQPSPAPPSVSADTVKPVTAASAPIANDDTVRKDLIRRLQLALKTLGQFAGGADGNASSSTASASQAWAQSERIAAPELDGALPPLQAFVARADRAADDWKKRDSAAWETAVALNSPESFKSYLSEYPTGAFSGAAKSQLQILSASVASSRALQVDRNAPARSTGDSFADCVDCPEMVVIAAGSFMMGAPPNETGRFNNEGPQRRVNVQGFNASRNEVSWEEYNACVNAGECSPLKDDGFGKGARPVTNASWNDAQTYVKWLTRLTGHQYRLPSEAEWEYIARAGSTTAFPWGNVASREHANYGKDACCGGAISGQDQWTNTSPAGSFPANAFGLSDMHGNVWEWVEDCYAETYSAGQRNDGRPFASADCPTRVVRGGSWNYDPQFLRSAVRKGSRPNDRLNYVGFRVARIL